MLHGSTQEVAIAASSLSILRSCRRPIGPELQDQEFQQCRQTTAPVLELGPKKCIRTSPRAHLEASASRTRKRPMIAPQGSARGLWWIPQNRKQPPLSSNPGSQDYRARMSAARRFSCRRSSFGAVLGRIGCFPENPCPNGLGQSGCRGLEGD